MSSRDFLTDAQRCDAWDLGISVATLQAQGVRELHTLLHEAKEELAKQVFVVSTCLSKFQEEQAEKVRIGSQTLYRCSKTTSLSAANIDRLPFLSL